MNGQINDRIKLEEETLRHRRKDSHVGRLGGEARSSPRTEARLRTHGVESPEARLRTPSVESPEHVRAHIRWRAQSTPVHRSTPVHAWGGEPRSTPAHTLGGEPKSTPAHTRALDADKDAKTAR